VVEIDAAPRRDGDGSLVRRIARVIRRRARRIHVEPMRMSGLLDQLPEDAFREW
jgi:hypothetical protein